MGKEERGNGKGKIKKKGDDAHVSVPTWWSLGFFCKTQRGQAGCKYFTRCIGITSSNMLCSDEPVERKVARKHQRYGNT